MAEAVLRWPGLRSEYAWLAPHEGTTVTGGNQIGVSFRHHRKLVWESDGRATEGDVPPGSTIVTGHAGITWSRVREHTEALEIYPDSELLRRLAGPWRSGPVEAPTMVGVSDGVVLGIASVLRRAHVTGSYLSDVAGSTLAERLAIHLLSRYCGIAGLRREATRGRLDARTVDRVAEFVDAHLDAPLSLARLAEAAHLSPFHFARAFRDTVGMPPHEFVTSRRMDRAAALLQNTAMPVADVANAVGFTNVSHFRRVFRRHTGRLPSDLRA